MDLRMSVERGERVEQDRTASYIVLYMSAALCALYAPFSPWGWPMVRMRRGGGEEEGERRRERERECVEEGKGGGRKKKEVGVLAFLWCLYCN